MKPLKDYKGVAILYLVLTIVSIFWVVGFDKPNTTKRVSNDKSIVLNA